MCGRFYIATEDTAEELQQIIDSLQRKNGPSIKTGEVFPTDIAAVIANNRSLTPTPFAMKWGYSLQNSRPVINARSETADQKPLFRDGMEQRRCLIPASWYFEWDRSSGRKIKNAIKPAGCNMMYMAGIYRIINGTPEFTILTREPADSIRHIHDRMPVILPQVISKDWLNVHFRANEVLRSADLNMEHTPEITAFA